jgi:hypothetical protein
MTIPAETRARDSIAEAGPKPRRLAGLLFAAGLLLVYVTQCVWFIRTQSFTVDEPEHIVAGLEAWRYGEFKQWHDQPPLARLLFAIPLLRTDWSYAYIGQQVHPIQPGPEVWLHRARAMNLLFGVALAVVLWITVRRMYSESAANFALALFAFTPELIAHYSLATTDGAATLFLFAAVVQLVRWRRNPSAGQAILLGLLLGGMLLAKFSMPPMFLLAMVLILLLKADGVVWRPRRWNWARAALVLFVACGVVWTGYFYHVSKVVFADGTVTLHFPGYTKLLTYPMPTPKYLAVEIPACEWFTGLGMVVYNNDMGHRSFFLGHVSPTGGWKLYFPVAVLLKWPTAVLLLAACAVVLLFRRGLPGRSDLLLMSLFPAAYFTFAIFSRINIGVRHVLPVYPFLLLYAAALWEWARGRRAVTALLLAAVLFQAGDCLRYAPDYLSYFNIFVNPEKGYELLSDSNTDWGQGLVALRNYQASHPSETLHLAYFGLVDPSWYDIRYLPLEESDRATGTVIVSATHLSGQLLQNPSSYHWLMAYPLKTVLDHTLYVFEVPANAFPQTGPGL